MLFYVARHLGGVHGTAKSAKDLLFAILACDQPVTVLSPRQCVIPATAAGFSLRRPTWVRPPPRLVAFPSEIGLRYPGRVASWARKRLLWGQFKRAIGETAGEDLVIVNGWASHDFWARVRSGDQRQTDPRGP